ncbi:MAG TPA: hypothetical protein PKG54_14990 [Phycisphaerae bacterium]|jgi:hypothetical protein|nr:hypothetical protein [Phycisphaerae bacterium]HOB75820.1 hypothetical protein [Phycisphaerae bacterium]HOJ54553.1 hypothetical protein [Phycisphaerae bacterium]HOL27054.1 hypothetical protein [Phycisphaerae bacterium]HPP22148.1 hypothetical protein [Phycisphaerae bacterium]
MSLMRMPWTIAGQWVTGITLVAFFIAGCESILPPVDGGDDGDSLFGVIVNRDSSTDLLGGVRMRSGEAVYAFGTFNPDGTVGEVTSAAYQNAAGQVARLYFESGRPVQAVGFDGSTLTIAYTSVNLQRLAGTATYAPAGGAPVSVAFDVDLEKAAADVAAEVQELFGITTSSAAPPPPSTGAEGGVKARTIEGDVQTKSAVAIVLVPVFIAITGFSIVLVVSQIAKAFVAVGNVVVLAFLTPFILMGNLMRAALGLPLVTIDYDPLNPVINVPRP